MARNMAKNPAKWIEKRAKRLKKWQIMAIVGILIIAVGAISAGLYYGGVIGPGPTRKKQLNTLELKATSYYSADTIPSDKTFTATVYNNDKEQVRSVTLTSPSWKETLTGLEITGKYYIQVTDGSNMYWMRDASAGTDVQLGDDSYARQVNITASDMSFVSQFADVSSVDWFYGENETGLGGAGSTSFTLTEKYTMRNYSAFRGYQLRFTVNNTSAVNITSIDYDGTTYDSSDWNTSRDGNVTTYKVNITTLTDGGWTSHTNNGKDANKSLTISGTADINATDTVTIEAWGRYIEPGLYEDSWATTGTQKVYLS